VKPTGIPVTLAQAAEQTGRSERTVQRWIHLKLLSAYRTADGRRVVMIADVMRVERDQRRRTATRKRRRDEMLSKLRPVA